MKLSTGVRLLRALNSKPENALTTQQIARKWRDIDGEEVSLRSIQRYMGSLSENVAGQKPLVVVTVVDGERAFYLNPSQVANWFITEEAALDLHLTQQVYGRAFGARGRSNGDNLANMAEQVTSASPETMRIRERLRIVPDGIGRLPARIDPKALQAAITAIGKAKKLNFEYTSAAGRTSEQLLSPLALVAKDSTIYLVAVKGLSDAPRHFALHRMSSADVHFQTSQARPEFDLDRYIIDSHQFSHVLNVDAAPLPLKLRVAPEALFHFKERPLSANQSIRQDKQLDNWHLVTATVPDTVLLVPFLVGMGPHIEVVEPQAMRDKTAQWLKASLAHYLGESSVN